MSEAKRYLLSRGELLCADSLKPASLYRMVDADDYDRDTQALRDDLQTADTACFLSIAENKKLAAEVKHLRHGLTGDYDLDAWLDWCKERDAIAAENKRLEGEVRDLTERRNDLARKLIGKNQEWKALIALLQEIYQTPLDRFYRDGLNVKINAELVRAAALSTTANGEQLASASEGD